MNGNAQKLIKYMDGASKRFVIPVYQRNYEVLDLLWYVCKWIHDRMVNKKINKLSFSPPSAATPKVLTLTTRSLVCMSTL